MISSPHLAAESSEKESEGVSMVAGRDWLAEFNEQVKLGISEGAEQVLSNIESNIRTGRVGFIDMHLKSLDNLHKFALEQNVPFDKNFYDDRLEKLLRTGAKLAIDSSIDSVGRSVRLGFLVNVKGVREDIKTFLDLLRKYNTESPIGLSDIEDLITKEVRNGLLEGVKSVQRGIYQSASLGYAENVKSGFVQLDSYFNEATRMGVDVGDADEIRKETLEGVKNNLVSGVEAIRSSLQSELRRGNFNSGFIGSSVDNAHQKMDKIFGLAAELGVTIGDITEEHKKIDALASELNVIS